MEGISSHRKDSGHAQMDNHGDADKEGFDQFCIALEPLLNRSQSLTLATLLGYPPAQIDIISNGDNPSRSFIQCMAERGEISSRDISVLINALESKVVSLHGVAANIKEAFHRHLAKPAKPVPLKTDLQGKTAVFIKQLKTKYRNVCGATRPVPYLPKRFSIHKLFIDTGAEFLEDNQGEREKWTALKSCRSVRIDPRVKSKRRLVKGDAGFGKSTFALQIAHDWINNHESMEDVEILIYIRLRQCRNLPSVYSAIKRFLLPRESEITEADIKEILRDSIDSTMLLLDGYDEYPDQCNEDTDINFIIKGDMFPDCEVILTSRNIPDEYSSDTQIIRLTGFDDTTRDMYIDKAVVRGDGEAAKSIKEIFHENDVLVNFCNVPLFFVMVAHMTFWHSKFKNIKTITKFFESLIACFESHEQIREISARRQRDIKFDKSHDILSQVAFDGLKDKMLSWTKDDLLAKLGQELYDHYVSIGILVEEDVFHFESFSNQTILSFYHYLFQEWFAAQYLAREAARPEIQFEPWPAVGTGRKSSREQPGSDDRKILLKSLDPVHTMDVYQFACGLNGDAALKIIEHLSRVDYQWHFALRCIREWGGNLENIINIVTTICSSALSFDKDRSSSQEKSLTELVEFASMKKIPISGLCLYSCLDANSMSKGLLQLKKSRVCLPVMKTLGQLSIYDCDLEISEEQMNGILQYMSMCTALKSLTFGFCLLPRFVHLPESLQSRDFAVMWMPGPCRIYFLNKRSYQWEMMAFFKEPMTDEEYDEVVTIVRQRSRSLRDNQQSANNV